VNHVALSEDGRKAFSIDAIKDRFFWRLDTFKQQSELQTSLRFLEINHARFSENQQLFLTGSPKQKIQLWRVIDGELVGQWQSFQIGRSSVLAVSLVDSHTIATITSDGMYEVFPLITPQK
jgi:WD40 repeat protein